MIITCVEPYDFALSLRAARAFQPLISAPGPVLRLAARISGTPVLIEVRQTGGPESLLRAFAPPEIDRDQVSSIVQWLLFAELDLKPFYRLVSGNEKLAPVIQKLQGLKPMRPVSLFEMAVIAVTEQQISLAAAYRIRERLIQKYGEPVEDLRVFPEPQTLAGASLEDLRSCGLSLRKSEYIRDLAARIAGGDLDLDSLKTMDTGQARETIMKWRGFGRWSADYILIRGLARPDCVPVDDLGIRDVVGHNLGEGRRISAPEVAEMLEPFRPYRGLVAFYLLANYRLRKLS